MASGRKGVTDRKGVRMNYDINHPDTFSCFIYGDPPTKWHAYWGLSADLNQRAGAALANLVSDLQAQRLDLGCEEPIYIIAYSNGANVAISALMRNSMEVDGIVFIGGATGRKKYGSGVYKHAGHVTNYHSSRDDATWYVDGIGHFGLQPSRSALSNVTDRNIANVFHSQNEAAGHGYTIPASSRSRVSDYTHWLTDYMTENYYASDLQYAGNCCLSQLGVLRRPVGPTVNLDESRRIYNSGERN